jgi:hypothetical protein
MNNSRSQAITYGVERTPNRTKHVQSDFKSENRYTYCLNHPLRLST